MAMEKAAPPGRTVCHGCRVQTHELVDHDGSQRYRPVVLPGDGTVSREIMPGIMVSSPCPECGDGDDPGWLPGFVPPV
ncbi:MAG TPA: hypothetical protein VG247_08955 [Pseudonocardiaceae bacterium]|nr:hypothetical protein [Pseudonocardiaceae bacterium]